MSRVMRFQLNISYDKYLLVYQGQAEFIHATATDGRTLQFPAKVVKPFLTHRGIQGLFEIEFNQLNKFQSIRKIA